MTLGVVVNLALVAAVFVGGFAVERRVSSDAKLHALPWWGQLLVGGAAMSPFVIDILQVTVGPVDGLVVAFAVSIALWIVLPVLLARVVETEPQRTGGTCA